MLCALYGHSALDLRRDVKHQQQHAVWLAATAGLGQVVLLNPGKSVTQQGGSFGCRPFCVLPGSAGPMAGVHAAG
ncbi:hypothetical protein SBA5_360031 [Candidatus Sulfotelmatomonas gaucii]|uniref:Uncharacterized protein n=1 Tax=Candidatus Sulfuritelmatomonas gaucii TaxID=2043161 RepID=A0A2N9LI41_9BACT|nr:hypothetical protein SBA5_360031 [Candidatus Sulfotelmatomonas gaucii]